MSGMKRRDFLKTSGAALALALANPRAVLGANARIPVLLYHDISLENDGYNISPALFSAHMEWLYANGYKAISLNGLLSLKAEPGQKYVVITFDDGYASFLKYAFPLFEFYGFKSVLNLIGKYVGTYLTEIWNRPMLSWDEYRLLRDSGLVELGCHTLHAHTKRGALSLSRSALLDDLRAFNRIYKQELGKEPEILAWPYGLYDNDTMKTAVEAGFKLILTSDEGYLDPAGDYRMIPRLNMNNDIDLALFRKYMEAKL